MSQTTTTDELDAWVLETAGRAIAYARSLLGNLHQAEDVVQDCYCRLLQKKEVYDLPRDGLKLLLTSISNACINVRTRRKEMCHFTSRGEFERDSVAEPPDPRADLPEAIAIGHELEQAIADALNGLPEMQRAALELKSWGHSQQEIAEILNIGSSHAGVLVHRARQALSEVLAPYLEPK